MRMSDFAITPKIQTRFLIENTYKDSVEGEQQAPHYTNSRLAILQVRGYICLVASRVFLLPF